MMRVLFLRSALLALLCCMAAACGAQTLTIVHTGDTHSCIEPLPDDSPDAEQAGKGGFVRRATLLGRMRRQRPDLLLLDSGDFSQGSVYYTLFKGDAEVELMNRMGYDAATLGNHELDFGLDNLSRLLRMAQFPFVCCNVDFTGTPCEGLVEPYVVIERAGMRIGVLGVTHSFDGLVAKSCYGDAVWSDPVAPAQAAVDALRNEERCDVVVCLSHLGNFGDTGGDVAFIRDTRGIDVVLGGHSHTYWEHARYFPNADGRLVPLDHQGKNGRFVGVMTLEY